jgi:hypothetical protein
LFIPDPELPIPDPGPGVKKVPDPGSAKLFLIFPHCPGGADCAALVNARPTNLGLLLKVAAVIRDQPDRVKADFLNSLAEMDPLYKSELDYVLAYRCVEVAVFD